MVSAFLRMCPHLPSVGECFIETLKYYGEVFRSENMMVVHGECVMLIPPPFTMFKTGIMICDPYRAGINAAAGVSKFEDLKQLFLDSCNKLAKIRDTYASEAQKDKVLKQIFSKNKNKNR